MKKILWFIFVGLFVMACCNDEKNSKTNDFGMDTTVVVTPNSINEFIEGEWVADYAIDDPKGYRWEIIKFQESGMMYFSNFSERNAISHEYVNGTYSIEGNVIKTNCQLGWSDVYQTYNAELHVKQVDDYTLNADIVVGGQVVETNKYIKVIDKIELEKGDILPDYSKMMNGRAIQKFKSHNNYIATVDEKTGRINSEWSGSTYIDIVTDKGTAAVQINVNSILYFDYEDYVGATMKDIVGVFDRQNTTEDNVLVYKYNENYYPSLQQKSGNWKSMYIRLNSISGFVDNISLVAKDDVWFTDYQISDYLSGRYTTYQRTIKYDPIIGVSEAELEKSKDYYIGNSLEEAKVGVAWNTDSKVLSFVDLKDEHRNTVDYGHFMGLTAEDVKIIMGEPAYSKADEWIAYHIGGRYTNVIKFSFKNRDTNKNKKSIQEIVVHLYDDMDIDAAVSILDKKYEYDNELADTRVYNSYNPKMLVDIWLGNTTTTKLIQYVNRELDMDDGGLLPDYAAVVLNSVDDVKGSMGEPVETSTEQLPFGTYQFFGVFWYYDVKGNDYVNRVAVNRSNRWTNATNIVVYLKDGINPSDITSLLGNLYNYQEQDSDPDDGIFVYSTEIRNFDVWIEYDSKNGIIYYYRKN